MRKLLATVRAHDGSKPEIFVRPALEHGSGTAVSADDLSAGDG
jgi:hypothetical protein